MKLVIRYTVLGLLAAGLLVAAVVVFGSFISSSRMEMARAASGLGRTVAVELSAQKGLPDAKAVPPAAGASDDLARLSRENQRLRSEYAQLQGRLVAVLNWILANFRGKYPVGENYMSKLQITPLNDDFTLHPEARDFLQITAGEEAKINDAMGYARDVLAEIEAAIITVTNPRPDKVVLHIPRFEEEGQVLRDDLYSALEITLGANRFDRFIQVSESGLKSNFCQFGEAARTMVFELQYSDGEPAPLLRIKDGWVVDIGPNAQMVTATESVVTNLPGKYNQYASWLPAYVTEGMAQP